MCIPSQTTSWESSSPSSHRHHHHHHHDHPEESAGALSSLLVYNTSLCAAFSNFSLMTTAIPINNRQVRSLRYWFGVLVLMLSFGASFAHLRVFMRGAGDRRTMMMHDSPFSFLQRHHDDRENHLHAHPFLERMRHLFKHDEEEEEDDTINDASSLSILERVGEDSTEEEQERIQPEFERPPRRQDGYVRRRKGSK
mmetsp:Transcript_29509/g.43531  ORF Transcript_29509/g.43531 Transcript_29509/m.43531 type:complete len:196 (-) Transcript_29509:75-662(-)|eukprot:CAMPEP_0194054986 /NCGR_PEP_ID=MMETSP0009_2-20130614/55224_1 /TAXON_ID=210454 /ORGANISM="Grammatophora oceanica, Strain CCMP 410" /LENGTH=195 /DNA_ID=CAMNT_0038703723 /DNA_START=155 /DNA_END=742 /DNA_ORIENTATION=+